MELLIHLLVIVLVFSLIFKLLPLGSVNVGSDPLRIILWIILIIAVLNLVSGLLLYPPPYRPYYWPSF